MTTLITYLFGTLRENVPATRDELLTRFLCKLAAALCLFLFLLAATWATPGTAPLTFTS